MKILTDVMSGKAQPAAGYRGWQRQAVALTLNTVKRSQPVAVDVTDVAKWFWEVNTEYMDPTKDFPNMAPPWDLAWYEYTEPERMNRRGLSEKESESPLAGRRIAVLAMSKKRDVGWKSIYSLLQYADNQIVMMGTAQFTVDEQGRAYVKKEENDGTSVFTKDPGQQVVNGVLSFIHPVFAAVSLAHCKNVRLQEHRPPEKVAKKRRKQGKPIGVTYKTLVIDGMKEVLRTEGGVEKNGLKKALHICRGHFATYTEDKPLFGKVTGTFWKPMHTRGSKKRGEVRKDYKVVTDGTKGH